MISGSTMISDLTEFATRLYFWAACTARRDSGFHDFLAFIGPRGNPDHGTKTQFGKDLRAIEFNQLGAFGAALIRDAS